MRRIIRHRPSPAMAVAFIALLVAIGGVAVASIPGPGGVVKGCYSKSTGSLRVIDSKKSCSKKHERTLSWNQQGPRGLQGPQGFQGFQGTPGNAGGQGTPGASATKLFAWVRDGPSGDAVVEYGSGVTGVLDASSPGDYTVTFNRSVANCTVFTQAGIGYPASGPTQTSTQFAGQNIQATGQVRILFSGGGAGGPSDTSFFIAAFC